MCEPRSALTGAGAEPGRMADLPVAAAIEAMRDPAGILSLVLDDAGEPVDFRVEVANDAYCALQGRTRDEIEGRLASEVYPDLPPERFATYSEVAASGVAQRIELVRPEGATGQAVQRVMEMTVARLGDGVLITAREVTDRHRLTEALAVREERFRAALNASFVGVVILSPILAGADRTEIVDFRLEFANQPYARMVGIDRHALEGRPLGELFPHFPGSSRFALYREVALTGRPALTEEMSDVDAWGETAVVGRVLDVAAVAMGGELLITARDVTERRRAEEELTLRAELLELAHDAVIVRDPVDSRVRFWNREAELIYGYSAAEAGGQVTHELLATVFPVSVAAADAALERDGHWTGDLRHTCKDGRVIVVTSRQALLRDGEGRPRAVIELNSDVTASRAAAERVAELNRHLRRQAAELDAANRELEAFAYSVAHDLRAPLRAISGFTDLLARGDHLAPDDDRGRALLARVTAASGRMGELIEALLALAQLSRRTVTVAPVDVSAIAREVAAELAAGDPGRAATFVIADGLRARGDPQLCRALIGILLENAWKYSRDRSPARIEVGRHDARTLVVSDNGAGFDMAHADQLFRPFGRLHRADEFPGTGVGLATAERIVRRHGGELRGEGRVGEGAAFYFSLSPDPEDP